MCVNISICLSLYAAAHVPQCPADTSFGHIGRILVFAHDYKSSKRVVTFDAAHIPPVEKKIEEGI